ncbi:heat-shock protein Hsp20 [Natrinema saccharevitans]|uniref:Heat-shock protein Hsp20 n=1 Tax=Natrinema saccharevitans TaxID=301967 RepID=A0A1S8AVY9_9EURY|nr:Hsp20/alpha crystallin family protein [Natrinema saccharevitans]OLZ41003.1 heat-shock protein Hsp20 [Natrinema saccharevitans]
MTDRPRPFDGIEDLLERLNRQVETAARSWERQVDDRSQLDLSMGNAETSLDLADEGEAFVATVDVPGYESDDLELRLIDRDRTLAISGQRERERETGDEGANYIRHERTTQSFSRQVRLPASVDADAVQASVNNGVLTVRLPKHEPDEEARSIDID